LFLQFDYSANQRVYRVFGHRRLGSFNAVPALGTKITTGIAGGCKLDI
jgi:hypothetical protein